MSGKDSSIQSRKDAALNDIAESSLDDHSSSLSKETSTTLEEEFDGQLGKVMHRTTSTPSFTHSRSGAIASTHGVDGGRENKEGKLELHQTSSTTAAAHRTAPAPAPTSSHSSANASTHVTDADRGNKDGAVQVHQTTSTTTTMSAQGQLEAYDCLDVFGRHWEVWTDAKTAWCCRHYDRGCLDIETSTSSPPPPAGAQGLEACNTMCTVTGRRSVSAKCWEHMTMMQEASKSRDPDQCARSHGLVVGRCSGCLGCALSTVCPGASATGLRAVGRDPDVASAAAVTTTDRPYDCRPSSAKPEESWPYEKRDWCCQIHGVGCSDKPPTHATFVDCAVRLSGELLGWSSERRQWCCQHHVGHPSCPATTTSTTSSVRLLQDRYECTESDPGAALDWSVERKLWCCGNALQPYEAWPEPQRCWCCASMGGPCPGDPVAAAAALDGGGGDVGAVGLQAVAAGGGAGGGAGIRPGGRLGGMATWTGPSTLAVAATASLGCAAVALLQATPRTGGLRRSEDIDIASRGHYLPVAGQEDASTPWLLAA